MDDTRCIRELYSLSAELSQLTVTAANMTAMYSNWLLYTSYSPPQSAELVCVMGSS